MSTELYAFVFRALLAEEALDKTERLPRPGLGVNLDADVAARLPLDDLDEALVARAKRMATVYIAIAAFENSVREFVSKRLLEQIGADWWVSCVSEKIRSKATARKEEETKERWHTPRSDEPIGYTDFGDLTSIVGQNWTHFEDYLPSQDWIRHIINTLERSRNVIMHSGELEVQDIERIGGCVRDWIRQIGA